MRNPSMSTQTVFLCLRICIVLGLLIETIAQPLALFAAPYPTPLLSSTSSSSASTPTVSVQTEATTAALGIPELIGPDDGIVSTGRTHPPVGLPRLSWSPVEGAEYYEVQISQTSGFAEVTSLAKTYATTYITRIALRNGTYYWRVRAGAGGNQWGEYSASRTFTKDWTDDGTFVPELLSPPDGAERIAFTNDDFTWKPFQGAAQYLFEISSDPTFSNIAYAATTIKAAHTPLERLPTNLYYWRVTPIDHQDGFGDPSAVWSFSFGWKVAPQLLSPAADIDLAFLPRFSWTAIEAAAKYELQISTQEDFGTTNSYQTTNTEYTPLESLSNDQDYFWRVKAIDEEKNSSPWSEVRRFRIRWNFQTQHLAPVNGVIQQANPFFAWTPIPGAERYEIQVDENTSYTRPLMKKSFYNVTTAGVVRFDESTVYMDVDYFWRVRAIDAQGNYTPWSTDNTFRYGTSTSPNLVHPLPYYEPDKVNTPVHSDRTIAWPLFVWDSAVHLIEDQEEETYEFLSPQYYEITVAADVFFSDIRFQVETAGSYGTPTLSQPFINLENGGTYYWRVRAFLENGQQVGVDQVWKTRIDRSAPERAYTESITPIFPADGFTAVSTAPLLGWSPVPGAANYRLQLSKDVNFNELVEDVFPQFVNYAPWQGRREPLPMGTYYWRVRAESSQGIALGGWSDVRYFHLADHILMGNRYDFVPEEYPSTIITDVTKIASSSVVRQDDYEIGDLHIMLNRVNLRLGYPTEWDNPNWIFAFGVKRDISNPVRYALYIDTDHILGSGATSDLMGKPISVAGLYLPDYMVIVERDPDNQLETADVTIFGWKNGAWAPGQTLAVLGGDVWFSEGGPTTGDEAIQLLVPLTAIGTSPTNADDFSGSLAVTLISTSQNSGDGIFDSVPPQSNNMIQTPAFVSNMLLPLYPFDTPLTNPMVHEDMPPLRWRMPSFSSNDGYEVQIARDAKFTDIVEEWEINEARQGIWYPFLTTTYQPLNPYEDNETYYWRVRLRHERYDSSSSQFDRGYWSQPMRFKLNSRKVGNPMLSTGDLANTTPSFWWDRVEGAAGYTLQVDDDSNFSSPIINTKIDGTSYTPLNQLKDGTYYWRVAMRRSSKVIGQWTPTMTFVKQSLSPKPLSPINGVVINTQPTFKWTAVLTPTDVPRVAMPLYRLQLDEDPNFGSPATYATQSTSFTIPGDKSLFDGRFYWRVAAVDASGNVGAYSATQEFYKEYLTPTPIRPIGNTPFTKATSFEWEPLPGAAYYEIEIDDDSQYSRPIVRTVTDNTVFTPIENLTDPQYYWRVRMYDADKNPGPWYGGLINVEEIIHTLGNYVWVDDNNNALVDEGEDPVPDGVLLELLDGAGSPLGQTTTTTNGFYLFTNIGSGEYRVRLAAGNFAAGGLLQNYSHSSGGVQEGDPNANGDQNDNGLDLSDPVVDGITSAKIALTEDEEPIGESPTAAGNPGDDGNATKDANSNLTLDFGVVSPENTYSIGNFVGLDANNDGQIDLDDENKPIGLPTGVLLELLYGDGTPTGRSTTTHNGYYIFGGLPKGSYRVRIAASNFTPGGLLEYYGHSTGEYQEDNPNNHGDQNDNGLNGSIPRSDGISSGIIELGADEPMGETTTMNNLAGSDGRDTPDAHSNLTIDFALVRTVPTAVEDKFIFLPIVSR